MKVNKKCVRHMYKMLATTLLIFSACTRSSDTYVLTEEYPKLYSAVFERQQDLIMDYTSHELNQVREQAWRAMVSTPISDTLGFIDAVYNSGSDIAWLALSTKELESDHLRKLEDWWQDDRAVRSGVSRVLGKQGDSQSMDFLLKNRDQFAGTDAGYHSALAIGRLRLNNEMDDSTEVWLMSQAIQNADNETGPAYLFGYYRSSGLLIKGPAADMLWENRNSGNDMFRQYVLKILLREDKEQRLNELLDDGIENKNVQEATEIALGTVGMDWNELSEEVYTQLLNYDNPVVNQVTLEIITSYDQRPGEFDEWIITNVIENDSKDVAVRLGGIQALKNPAPFVETAKEWAMKDEYLLNRLFSVLKRFEEPSEYFNSLREIYENSSERSAYFVVNSLPGWWTPLSDAEKRAVGIDEMREFVFGVLERGNRSMTFSMGSVLADESLLRDEDYERLSGTLKAFSLPEDVEVYQALSGLLFLRFEEQAGPLIDSLASSNNVALNRTFKNDGWDVDADSAGQISFREPDWDRLAELHEDPYWKLETTKGTVKIRLNVMSAPATLGGMDSLSAAGAYDGVAFHRVVPNFVIQGGDVETGNGFGGPDYVVPTESSEMEYLRGVVGIASAGTDTEGSQYFIMHKWDPRLNGAYTVIGEVVEGMDVVDRIVVGDRVLSSDTGMD